MLQEWLSKKQGQVFCHKMEKCQYALEQLGRPHLEFPVVHVAGTNGKGSTIAMMTQLFQSQGLQVGSFTSPHLVSVEDRIRINGVPIDSATFWLLAGEIFLLEEQVKEVYEPFSYFETITLMMFLYFQRQPIDIALIEVGIGGLCDVTNLVQPMVSVITSIGLDHQDLLGSSLEEIAEQKAGIIKTAVPVVLGPLEEKSRAVCLRRAIEKQSPVFLYRRDFFLEERIFIHKKGCVGEIDISLRGRHQIENAAVALEVFWLVMSQLQCPIKKSAVRYAMANVQWEGRIELMTQQPSIYLDGAHNVPAIIRLIDYIVEENLQECTILFAALYRKDYQEMLQLLRERLPQAKIFVALFEGGGYSENKKPEGASLVVNYRDFLDDWRKMANSLDTLFVTGSLYFISEVRSYLLKK